MKNSSGWTSLSKTGSKYNVYMKDGFDSELYNVLNVEPPIGVFTDWMDFSEFIDELEKYGFGFNFGIDIIQNPKSTNSYYSAVSFDFMIKGTDFDDSAIVNLSGFFRPRLSHIENVSIDSHKGSDQKRFLKITLSFGESPKGKFSMKKVDVTNVFINFINSIFDDDLLTEKRMEVMRLSAL